MTAEESLKWIGEDLLKQCPGYIKKPGTKDQVKSELESLRYPEIRKKSPCDF